MNAEIEIIPAGQVHADLLAGMHKVCFAEPWNAPSMAGILAMPRTFALIAVAGGSLAPSLGGAGPAALILFRAAATEGEILTLAVLPPWRRRGIAASLLDRAIATLGEAGVEELFLEAAADNQAAIRLYQGKGFATVGVRKGYYAGIDAITMRRGLI